MNPRLMTLMGGTTKENDSSKIGFFGTGGKYVMSYMMRNNLDLRIFSGKKEVDLKIVSESVNDVDFKVMHVDGIPTSITDKMGRDWKPWYIIREVWSNAIDEGDEQRTLTTDVIGEDGRTCFYLECDVKFMRIWDNWSNYFIHNLTPVAVETGFKLYSGDNRFLRVYKQGVLVKEIESPGGSIFSYDVDDCPLNELRELRESIDFIIPHIVSTMTNHKAIEYFLENCSDEVAEGVLDYNWYNVSYNGSWKEVIGESKLIHKESLDKIKARQPNIDISGIIVVAKNLYTSLTKKFEGISAVRIANKVNEFYECIEPTLEANLKDAIELLRSCDYWMHPELKYIFGEFGNKSTLASVSLDKKEVLISNKFLHKPMFDLCAMLIEENEHFNTGLSDETRDFQQHFINLFTKTLLEKHNIEL